MAPGFEDDHADDEDEDDDGDDDEVHLLLLLMEPGQAFFTPPMDSAAAIQTALPDWHHAFLAHYDLDYDDDDQQSPGLHSLWDFLQDWVKPE